MHLGYKRAAAARAEARQAREKAREIRSRIFEEDFVAEDGGSRQPRPR